MTTSRIAKWLRGSLDRSLRPLPGQAILMAPFMIVMLFGFVALVADAGMIYVTKERLQNSVDAAALAGAQSLPLAFAEDRACQYIDANLVSGMSGTSTKCGGKATVVLTPSGANPDTITVTSTRTAPTIIFSTFGKMLGETTGLTTVSATATVRIGGVGGASQSCIFPFYFVRREVETLFAPKLIDRGGVAINTPPGVTGIREAMAWPNGCGAPSSTVGIVDLDPERAQSPYVAGWEKRFENGYGSCPDPLFPNNVVQVAPNKYELLPTLTPKNCPRLILIPVLKNPPGTTYTGGEDDVPILGFAAFWVEGACTPPGGNTCSVPAGFGSGTVNKGAAWGYFVPFNIISTSNTTYDGFGAKVIVMEK